MCLPNVILDLCFNWLAGLQPHGPWKREEKSLRRNRTYVFMSGCVCLFLNKNCPITDPLLLNRGKKNQVKIKRHSVK